MRIRPDVEALVRAGLSNAAAARQLRVSTETVRATRRALGLPPSRHGYRGGLSLEEAWAARTRPVDGGHLEWTGHRNDHGVPKLHHAGRKHSAYKIAFRIRTGRDPEGRAHPSCGHPGCVAPAHIDDTAIRQRDRAAMRAVLRMPPRPVVCRHGHDQAVHGRIRADNNRHYCAACDAARPAKEAA